MVKVIGINTKQVVNAKGPTNKSMVAGYFIHLDFFLRYGAAFLLHFIDTAKELKIVAYMHTSNFLIKLFYLEDFKTA